MIKRVIYLILDIIQAKITSLSYSISTDTLFSGAEDGTVMTLVVSVRFVFH